jgi:hypothetical protein
VLPAALGEEMGLAALEELGFRLATITLPLP